MSNLFHSYDPALRGTRIPKPSNHPGQDKDKDKDQDKDQDQDQDQAQKEKNSENENQEAWKQMKTQVDVLGEIVTRIKEKDEMSLEGIQRELEGVEKIWGMMGRLCKEMLGENLEDGEIREDEDEDDKEVLKRRRRRRRWQKREDE